MTTDKFPTFAKAVAASFQSIVKADQVFVTNVDGDALYQRYLAAFPAGTNPVFKKQTEHAAIQIDHDPTPQELRCGHGPKHGCGKGKKR